MGSAIGDKLLQALIELLTKGWPVATVILVWLLRDPLKQVLPRLKTAEAGPKGIKVALRAGLEEARAEAPQLPAASPAAPNETPASPWQRCGNVYWLGNNTVFAALAILAGDQKLAIQELENAIHHAEQLPIDEQYITELRAFAARLRAIPLLAFFDGSDWTELVQGLTRTASLMGKFIAHQQQDFPERDIGTAKGAK